MSVVKKMDVICNRCQQSNKFKIWYSINTNISPKAKKLLLKGDLFRFKCKKCKHINNIEYNVLYHDPIKNYSFTLTPTLSTMIR